MKTISLLTIVVLAKLSVAFAIPIVGFGVNYSQDFNALANSGTSSTLPAGWAMAESGANQNTTYAAGTGSSATGDTYSLGAAASTDRALGGLRSSSLIPLFGASFQNNAGSAIF